MTEPQEPQEPTEPQEPVETPTEPVEPAEEPGEGDYPPEEGEPPEGPEETPPSGQPQGKSEKDIEKGLQALEREAQRHAKRVGEIMEEDAQHLLRCELCDPLIPGFRWPLLTEDQRAAVMLAIGFEPEPELLPDTHSAVCPDCDGWGKVATGSHVQGQKALDCLACNGQGWRGPRQTIKVTVTTTASDNVQGNGPQPVPVSDPEREAARKAAEAAGYMIIDPRVTAA
jgi:hypothetical protein